MSPLLYATVFASAVFAVSTNGSAAARRTTSGCDLESTQAAMLVCYDKIAKHIEIEVEAAYRRRLTEAKMADAAVRKVSTEAPNFAKGLQTGQAAWKRFVDAECGFEGRTSFGGSGDDILQLACHVRLGHQRLVDLKVINGLMHR